MRQHHLRPISVSIVATIHLLTFQGVHAEPRSEMSIIVDRLPGDAMLVVAWDVSREAKAAFTKSALGQIVAEPSVQEFASALGAAIWSAAEQKTGETEARVILDAIRDCLAILSQSSGALFIAPGDPKVGSPVNLGIVLDAADVKEDIQSVLMRIDDILVKPVEREVAGTHFQSTPDGRLTWGWMEDYFAFSIGDVEPLVHSIRGRSPGLGSSENWKKRLAAVPMEAEVGLLYVDVGRIVQVVQAVGETEGEASWPMVAKAFQGLGLATTEAFIFRCGFRADDFQMHSTLFAGEPHEGLWRVIDGKVGLERMKWVPADATWAGAGTFRPAELLSTILETIRTVRPETSTVVEQRIHEIEKTVGVPIREEILNPLTGSFSYYALPSMFGVQAAVTFDVADERRFADAVGDLEKFLASKAQPGMCSVQEETIEERVVAVHHWNLLSVGVPFAFRWAVVERKWILELSGSGASIAMASTIRNDNNLFQVPDFQARTGGFPDDMAYYSYSNDQARAMEGLAVVGGLWPMIQVFAQSQANITLPFPPPSSAITEHLGTSGSYTYVDSLGLHTRTAGSLPITNAPAMAGGGAMGASILLPSLTRARELAKRQVSAANLKGIGIASLIYAQDHDGVFPENFEALIESGNISENMLKNPRVGEDVNSHYVYLPGHNSESTPQNSIDPSRLAVAFEDPALVDEGINVLFRDGHVEFLRGEDAFTPILESYKAMGKEPPVLKYKKEDSNSFLNQLMGISD